MDMLAKQKSATKEGFFSYRSKLSIGRTVSYVFLISLSILMLLPFVWMLSASLKLDKDVFRFPIEWIPMNPQWSNYETIWTRIPFLTFFLLYK